MAERRIIVLELKNLHKTFNAGAYNELKVLRGLNLEIKPGGFVILLGNAGAGKTTLLDCIAGRKALDRGQVIIAGEDMTQQPEHERAQHLARVFQDPTTGNFPDMSVAENLALALQRGKRRGLKLALSRLNLERFEDRLQGLNMGLEKLLHEKPHHISDLQRQALNLLMATWQQPAVLLLDEPTASLGQRDAGILLQITSEIIESYSQTAVLATKSIQQAASLGDRVVMLHQGQIIHDLRGADKESMTVNDYIMLFEEARRRDQVNSVVAQMMRRQGRQTN